MRRRRRRKRRTRRKGDGAEESGRSEGRRGRATAAAKCNPKVEPEAAEEPRRGGSREAEKSSALVHPSSGGTWWRAPGTRHRTALPQHPFRRSGSFLPLRNHHGIWKFLVLAPSFFMVFPELRPFLKFLKNENFCPVIRVVSTLTG